jgi:hypothetical protein
MNLDDIKIDEYCEIKSVGDFTLKKEWNDGRLIVLKNECFSTLEVTEKNKLKTKKLVNFPNGHCIFKTFPAINVIYGYSGGVTQLFYDLDTNKTLLFEPIFTRRYWARGAQLLDSEKKIFLLIYGHMLTQEKYDYFIYDLPNNKILLNPFDQKSDFLKDILEYRIGDYLFLCKERDKITPQKITNNYYIYDFKKKKRIDNELTTFLSGLKYPHEIEHLSLEDKIIIIRSYHCITEENLFISWEDDFKKIRTTPFFCPTFNDKKLKHAILSIHHNEWLVFCLFSEGLYGETLYRLGFSKINSPVRVPVVIDKYFEDTPPYFFLEHPIYGFCCFVEIEKNGRKTIRMYKMSDVQEKIKQNLNNQF